MTQCIQPSIRVHQLPSGRTNGATGLPARKQASHKVAEPMPDLSSFVQVEAIRMPYQQSHHVLTPGLYCTTAFTDRHCIWTLWSNCIVSLMLPAQEVGLVEVCRYCQQRAGDTKLDWRNFFCDTGMVKKSGGTVCFSRWLSEKVRQQ